MIDGQLSIDASQVVRDVAAMDAGKLETELASLSKDALMDRIADAYAQAKPVQDEMAERAVDLLLMNAEVFRRIAKKNLPKAEFTRTRIVTQLECSLNALGTAGPELNRRLNEFEKKGVMIVRVEYDEVLHRLIFHAEPTGFAPQVTEG